RAFRVLRCVADTLESIRDDALLQVLGPAPTPLERVEGQYRYHLLLKFAPESEPAPLLREALTALEPRDRAALQIDIDPISLM
ncbi:MAG: hypothetical protein NZ554_14555, partial [Bryobacteraceae bacterium]|nr:hypothetical protein [Bryobacteraceae bacterium]